MLQVQSSTKVIVAEHDKDHVRTSHPITHYRKLISVA